MLGTNCDADEEEGILKDITTSVMKDCAAVAVVLHGSRARGTNRVDSDIDLLLLYQDEEGSVLDLMRTIEVVNGKTVDVSHFSLQEALRELRMATRHNNNGILNALTGGRILIDDNGIANTLREEAWSIRNSKPAPPSSEDWNYIEYQLRHQLNVIRNSVHMVRGYFACLTSNCFYECVYSYCKVHAIWSDKLNVVLVRAETECPELHKLCARYLNATTPAEMIAALDAFSDSIMKSKAEAAT